MKTKKIKVVALLTGKGSSGLKNKNITPIYKIPLLGYACKAINKIKFIDDFYVSSEDKKILTTANRYGFKKILRPKSLAKKNTQHRDVLIHSLKYLKNKNIEPKYIIVVLANSATIKSNWIIDSFQKLQKSHNASACVAVIANNDHHPFRAKQITNKGYLKSFFKFKKKISSNRQDLTKNYFLAHNFWIIKTSEIYKNEGEGPWNFLGKRVLPYEIKSSVDVHDLKDILLTKLWLKDNRTT